LITPSKTNNNVHIISLGCPKNRIDTEAMMGQLTKKGYCFTNDINSAGTVIVNTCGFLQEAVEEGLAEISALALQKEQLGFRLVVTGCLVQRMGRSLKNEVPEIDALVGVHGYDNILAAVEGGKENSIPANGCDYHAKFYQNRLISTGPGWAYLRIADGCDNRCSYCLIPSIRGRFRSRPIPEIVREAKMMASLGVREINLIAQDTTAYGTDIYGRRSLPRLLKSLCRIEGPEWIRILYTHPAHIDDELMDILSREKKILKYLDVPLQHVSDRILKKMGRKVTKQRIVELLHRLRTKIPGIILRTTFIVGFPGEAKADFSELHDFAGEMKLDRVGVFAYSNEPGTRSARMPGQVSEKTKSQRLDSLMLLQRKISTNKNRLRVGQTVSVIIEGRAAKGNKDVPFKSGYQYYGRSYAEAPEIDGKIYIRNSRQLIMGRIYQAAIEKAWDYDLGGIVIR
jgi:ribosomal protein S12 methylthiotransferase